MVLWIVGAVAVTVMMLDYCSGFTTQRNRFFRAAKGSCGEQFPAEDVAIVDPVGQYGDGGAGMVIIMTVMVITRGGNTNGAEEQLHRVLDAD